ncbi:MAG: polyhydroxyalkanoic acid system family protein [Acidobacteria bacterium]|nr:polyhydroxyalkanoic acid system family protein [Acidobacteriota bacterium]
MRITIAHKKPKQEVVDSIDRGFDDVFKMDGLPVKLVLEQKSWQGSTLTFALSAKLGFMSSPIKGTIDVTDHDVTIDADLGMFEQFVSEDKVRGALATKFKGLLT